jgi:quinoprotein glucose dehydrogenase
MTRPRRSCALATAILACAPGAYAAEHPAAAHREWSVYNGGPDSIHYSSLDQINKDNVAQLTVAWTFDSGDAFPGSQIECNPIIVDGVLYATTPKLNVIALAAASGRLIWRFDPFRGGRTIGTLHNRAVTYWSDGKKAVIFSAARQFLYALDARTGQLIEDFGDHGRIDMRAGFARDVAGLSVSMSSPGIIYKDLIIIGSSLSETLPAAPGDIRAYDVRSGKLRWAFHTIPHPGEFGYHTWPQNAWRTSGAANNWAGMSVDVARGLVFVPTGSAAFDFYGADRIGDDLFANSLIALDAATGKRVWHFQTVRHDLWDRDLPAPPSLVSVERNGRRIDAVAQITKSGYVFLFNRVTGAPLFPLEYRSVPASDIPGEVAARSQPFPLRPAPFARQRLTEELLTERTPEAHQAVLAKFKTLRSAGQFVPGSTGGTIVFPGFDGGAEWGGAAFDPDTGYLYVNASEMANVLRVFERPPLADSGSAASLYQAECAGCHGADRRGSPGGEVPSLIGVADRYTEGEIVSVLMQGVDRMPSFARLGFGRVVAIKDFLAHGKDVATTPMDAAKDLQELKYTFDGYPQLLDPDGYPGIKPPWGTLNAINLNTGEYVWTVPLGEYPQLAATSAGPTGSANYGGSVVTAGGLLFIAATNYDRKFRAFDKLTGRLLWQTLLPASGNATPSVYEAGGREMIVIAAGGGRSKEPSRGVYVAFALPASPASNQRHEPASSSSGSPR